MKDWHVKILAVLILCSFAFAMVLSGCNKQIIDLQYQFNYAIIELPNGEIVEGRVELWNDYDESDQLQVKINGIYYLVHSTDVVLMSKPVSAITGMIEEVKEDD